jgi:ATP-dependent Lon protease
MTSKLANAAKEKLPQVPAVTAEQEVLGRNSGRTEETTGFRRSPRRRTLWSAEVERPSDEADPEGQELPSLKVFDPDEAKAMFRAEHGSGVPTSTVDLASGSKRDRNLIEMARDVRQGHRTLAVATPDIITSLETLQAAMPNCANAIAPVLLAAKASLISRTPLRFSPMILVGPPGTGKTRCMAKIAESLGTGFCRLSMPAVSGAQPLSGTDQTWKHPKPGKILTTLLSGKTANPIFGLDEIDKAFATHPGEHPLDVLHELWENESAQGFADDCLGLRVDASAILWICTANDLNTIRSSILDRAEGIDVPLPDAGQMARIVQVLFIELSALWSGWFEPELSQVVIAMLVDQHPRFARRLLSGAMQRAVARGSHAVSEDDMRAVLMATPARTGHRLGFI